MKEYFLGHHHGSQQPFYLPQKSFETHYHLIGGTGKGKTTLIHALLHKLMLDPTFTPCIFIIDKLGGLSTDLLMWMASPYCTPSIRNRLVYIEPARDQVVLPFNPLQFGELSEGYYKVSRAMEIILRGWTSQNIEAMPRLSRWLWNSFWAAAQLGLTIADCHHLVMPNSELHESLLKILPEQLRREWQSIKSARGRDAEILDSTRNRLKPYFDSPPLKNMFSGTHSHLDVLRFMQERKIVLINLASQNRLPEHNANAIGGMIINEVISTARSLPIQIRYPTFMVLDEFQNFVGPDIQAAIPEVRQLGLRMIFSHQSFSQLKRGDIDLTDLIFQCQSRCVFGVQGQDADLLAHEFTSLEYDPLRIKQELYSRSQWITGHKLVELQNKSFTQQQAQNWSETVGKNWSGSQNVSRRLGIPTGQVDGTSRGGSEGNSSGGSASNSETVAYNQSLLPIYEEVEQLASRTYFSFDEQRAEWARNIRQANKGVAYIRLVDDPTIYHIDVQRSAPGVLSWDADKLDRYYPQALDECERLKEENFAKELFVSPRAIEIQTQQRLEQVLRPVIRLTDEPSQDDSRFT